jgi:hypothetical protein
MVTAPDGDIQRADEAFLRKGVATRIRRQLLESCMARKPGKYDITGNTEGLWERETHHMLAAGPHGRKACPGSWCSLCRDLYDTTARLQQSTPKSSDTPPASEESPHASVRSACFAWKHRHGILEKTLKITCSGNAPKLRRRESHSKRHWR